MAETDDPMEGVEVTSETIAPKTDAKVKRELDEVQTVGDAADANRSVKTEHAPIKIEADMGPTKIKSEKKDEVEDLEERIKSETIKIEGVKTEGSVKTERNVDGSVKGENVKGENVKGENVKGENVKGENVKGENVKGENVKGENVKGENVKGENVKGENVKGENVKGENVKGENIKGEMKGEKVKGEMKRERSRSRRKKDKKDKKIKKEKRGEGERDRSRSRKKDKKDKKEAKDGRRKRQSKWGPEVGAVGFASMTAIPAGRSGLINLPTLEDQMPRFNDAELLVRTVVIENIKGSVTGQELIEFFNGAVLAVTANAVQQAANRSMAPVFACTVTETQHDGETKRNADLKFRTPDGANVGIKLNGIEYKGAKLLIRRPDKFDMPEAGDPSVGISLHEMSMARLVGSNASSSSLKAGGEAMPSPKLSIFNLPDVMSEDIVRSLLQQFGRLRMLSLIRDLATGKIKGYGIFEYDDPRDVDLAIQALNGFVCGQNVIRVQKLGGPAPGTAGAEAAKPQPVAATAMANSMTQKIVSNPVLAMQVKQGREVGSRPSTVVQMLNAVYQEDLMDDQDYEDIMSEIHQEASKHGAVSRVVIPKPAKNGSFVDGVGKIFVAFQDITSARRFQMESNGRKFENRVVCAAFYPSEKFSEGKFKLWST